MDPMSKHVSDSIPFLIALVGGIIPLVLIYSQSGTKETQEIVKKSEETEVQNLSDGILGGHADNYALIKYPPQKKGYIGVTPKPLSKGVEPMEGSRCHNCFVEASVSDFTSCIHASLGGVNSLELCCNRAEGGVTPSYGLIAAAVRHFRHSDVSIHVLIRPRGGDFCYSDGEMECIVQDVCMCRDLGVDGIVVGFLGPHGFIDYDKLQMVLDIVQKDVDPGVGTSGLRKGRMHVTFHRCIDICRDINETCYEASNDVAVALAVAADGGLDGDCSSISSNNVTFVDGEKHTSHVVVHSSRGSSSVTHRHTHLRSDSGLTTTSTTGSNCNIDADLKTSAVDIPSTKAVSVTGVSDTWVDCEAESSSYREEKRKKSKGKKSKGKDKGTDATALAVGPGPLVLASPTVISAPCSPLTVDEEGPSDAYMGSSLVRSAVATVRRLSSMGITRILTSGRCLRVNRSIQNGSGTNTMDNLIGALRHSEVGNSVQFMLASGIDADNVATVLHYTHAHCVHAGSAVHAPVTSILAESTASNTSGSCDDLDSKPMSSGQALGSNSHISNMNQVPTQIPYAEFQTTSIVDIELTRELVNNCIACWNVVEPKF